MDRFVFERMAHLLGIGIILVKNENIEAFQSQTEQNPIYKNMEFRSRLRDAADEQEIPYIYRDEFNVFYSCIKTEKSYVMIGPMATEYLNRSRRHQFYQKMGVDLDLDKNLHIFTVYEVLQIVEVFGKLIMATEFTDDELLEDNNLVTESMETVHHDAARYNIKAEDDEESYRHSYQEERQLLTSVREGNVEEALRRNKEMDESIGKLSKDDISHWHNVLVIGATLCARAAIEGGVSPYNAYRISGYYINKGSASNDILQILSYRNQAVKALAESVHEIKSKKHTSSYTKQCKDYVNHHYREKIYLEDIAEQLGISGSYLSRLFKKETGKNLQDYIIDIRIDAASNLLKYSEESIPRIAEYVNFPSQSYFGRVFKERMNMTPREYREEYKPTEFIEKYKNT